MILPPGRARLADGLFVAALMIFVLAGVSVTPMHGDEFMQMAMSRDVFYLAHGQMGQIQFSPPVQPDSEQELRLVNGPLNKDLIGLTWLLSGRTIADLPGIFAWEMSLSWNQTQGNVPSTNDLNSARLPSALLTAIGVVLIFAVGLRIGGRKAAYPAALLYTINPVILLNGRRAMMEGGLIACTLLLILVALWLTDIANSGEKSPRLWMRWALLGVCAGLVVVAKYPGIAIVGFVLFAVAWNAWRCPTIGLKCALIGTLVAGLIAVFTFLILNPVYWNNPVGATEAMIHSRIDLLARQVPSDPTKYTSFDQQILATFTEPFLRGVQYYEAPTWQGTIDDQIATYEASPLSGWRWPDWIGVILTLLSMAGLAIAVVRAVWRHDPVACILLAWAAAGFVTALVVPFAWQRYYLPWLLPQIILIGYALATLIVDSAGFLKVQVKSHY